MPKGLSIIAKGPRAIMCDRDLKALSTDLHMSLAELIPNCADGGEEIDDVDIELFPADFLRAVRKKWAAAGNYIKKMEAC